MLGVGSRPGSFPLWSRFLSTNPSGFHSTGLSFVVFYIVAGPFSFSPSAVVQSTTGLHDRVPALSISRVSTAAVQSATGYIELTSLFYVDF